MSRFRITHYYDIDPAVRRQMSRRYHVFEICDRDGNPERRMGLTSEDFYDLVDLIKQSRVLDDVPSGGSGIVGEIS